MAVACRNSSLVVFSVTLDPCRNDVFMPISVTTHYTDCLDTIATNDPWRHCSPPIPRKEQIKDKIIFNRRERNFTYFALYYYCTGVPDIDTGHTPATAIHAIAFFSKVFQSQE